MGQRLGIACALLGDPKILMFDEPVNGLDPEGIMWISNLMKALASEGRTVFVSSHLMSEMENTADHLIVIGRGKLISDCTTAEFIAANSQQSVRVRTPQPDELTLLATAAGATVRDDAGGTLVLLGMTAAQVGDLAFENGIRLHELASAHASLEQAFMELTASSVEFHAGLPEERGGASSERGRGGLRWRRQSVMRFSSAGRSAASRLAGPASSARCARSSPRSARCARPTGPCSR